jgi:zinc transporter ZupT
MLQFNRTYFAFTIFLFLLETAIALFVHDNFIRPYFGDFLVVMLLYCFLKSFLNVSVWAAAGLVLLFSFAIEIAQYFNMVEKLGLEHYKIAKVVLGNSFAWMDLLAYVLGILAVISIEKFIPKQENKKQ